ncbi:MAG: 16S rRNA (uracil(1498)-N(3))-methyltransferase [Verrucomicrobia bacterium]|nr:16S rRNA (uracil(1498)-N(3))-methyltransferase [Verrucomicrobiota bacterium]
MPLMHRFFLPDLGSLRLAGDEAHHCRDVFRLRSEDEIEVFDGCGNVVRCRIEALSKREVRLAALERRHAPPLPCRITLAVAVIRKNFEFIIQKATELGVNGIMPLITERTIVRADKTPRWTEIALEACKQCGNNWLPLVTPAQSLEEFLGAPSHFDLRLVAALHPGAKPVKSLLRSARSVCVLIGPEGDFTPAEYAAIGAAGFTPVTLGPLVLRADTAAIYALSVVHHELVVHGVV